MVERELSKTGGKAAGDHPARRRSQRQRGYYLPVLRDQQSLLLRLARALSRVRRGRSARPLEAPSHKSQRHQRGGDWEDRLPLPALPLRAAASSDVLQAVHLTGYTARRTPFVWPVAPYAEPRWQLVRHSRPPPLSRPQHFQALAFHHRLPAVVPRAVVAELATSSTYADLPGFCEQQQAMAKEQIIISHGGTSSWASSTHRMGRRFYSWEAPRCLQIFRSRS
jgi:hypothetical protein